jgi:hypothetical protein
VLTQFLSPDDEHEVLKTGRVKNKNKYIVKNCASRWSFTKDHNMMHYQQNVKLIKEYNKTDPVLTWKKTDTEDIIIHL